MKWDIDQEAEGFLTGKEEGSFSLQSVALGKLQRNVSKVLCQGPAICVCHYNYILRTRGFTSYPMCNLESKMKERKAVTIILHAAVISEPQPWDFLPRWHLEPPYSLTSLEPRSSPCSQRFTVPWLLPPHHVPLDRKPGDQHGS